MSLYWQTRWGTSSCVTKVSKRVKWTRPVTFTLGPNWKVSDHGRQEKVRPHKVKEHEVAYLTKAKKTAENNKNDKNSPELR